MVVGELPDTKTSQTPFVDARFVRGTYRLGKCKGCLLCSGILPRIEEGGERPMKDKIKAILKFISSYKMLFILWLILGIATLVTGSITPISYLCVWLCLLLEYLAKAVEGK